MTRYLWRAGGWVAMHRAKARPPGPYVIPDGMPPLKNMADGKTYDSKSSFRQATRAAGLLELGNDAPCASPKNMIDRKELREDIRTAMAQVEEGRKITPQSVPNDVPVRRYGRD